MFIVFIASTFVFLAYLTICIILIVHWFKTKNFECPDNFLPTTKVSVIIPVRNEAEGIIQCLDSIISQNYPPDLYEIIVVDDQSYDETPDLLENYDHPSVKYMRLGVERRTTIEGSKKKAIAYGVNHANGELIITTDGDCTLQANWIKTIVAFYKKTNAKLIVGPVLTRNASGLYQSFKSLDSMNTFLLHCSGISSGLFYLCSGANLAYVKEEFLKTNPYDANMHISSGDDVFLIQKFKQINKGNIAVCKSTEIISQTKSATSVSAFMSQRLRWSGKMKKVSNPASLIIAALVWFQRLLPILFLIWSICYNDFRMIAISFSIFILSLTIDFCLLYFSASFFQRTKNLRWFALVEILYSIYFVVLGVLSWLPLRLEWKDRKIKV